MKPIPLPEKPSLFPADVTVVVPTTASKPLDLIACLQSILESCPAKVFVVTSNTKVDRVKKRCEKDGLEIDRIEFIGVPRLNKRIQMVAALKLVKTVVTVFADDDVLWPYDYLSFLLASFEDPEVGAAGTRQKVRRGKSSISHFLGTSYLERRNFNTGATNAIDGSVSTLSGRTSAYRTSILQNQAFYMAFLNDKWFGRPLNSDDDKFLTRWIFSHNSKIRIQCDERAILQTSLEEGANFLAQCIRWARAHWRGNLVVMTKETYWFKKHVWSFYAIYVASFQTPALLVDGLQLWLLYRALSGLSWAVLIYFCSWIIFTKLVKLIPHFRHHPEDLRYIPVSIIFSYLHGIINIYALLTLQVTVWGSKNLNEADTGLVPDMIEPETEMI